MRKIALLFCCWGLSQLPAQPLPTPEDFLGYPLGSQFTYHHQVLAYFQKMDALSPRMTLIPYGKTPEGRDLLVAVLSHERNLARLDEIQRNQRIRAGQETGNVVGEELPVVWLSYNIHGNEAVSTEAAMGTLHSLLASDTARWLDQAVVILDPCINPDGRERYVSWYRQAANQSPNMFSDAYEHHEPWPGGRYNHYLFDLNRDWCWQTQAESRQRARLYHQWFPHVHVDFHEMGPESPYFFAPSARPYHAIISPWQRKFQELAGKNHSRYFDAKGWLYFTRETYDLFYPSYGDTWPTYQGALAFTYEQGGSGRAGRALLLSSGDTLTLAERIDHHMTTGLSTIEAAVRNRKQVLEEFQLYFQRAQQQGAGLYKSYVLKGDENPAALAALLKLLDRNLIRYGLAAQPRSLSGYDYRSGSTRSFRLEARDVVIPAAQPQAHLLAVLFEPRSMPEDSITYDLTAWGLPYAYDLPCYGVSEALVLSFPYVAPAQEASDAEAIYGYAAAWQDVRDARFLAQLMHQGVRARYAERPFRLDRVEYARGSLVFLRKDNAFEGFDELMREQADVLGVALRPLRSGYTEEGPDLGSDEVLLVKPPRVALVNGPGVAASAFGELWHYFEEQLGYPVSVIHSSYLGDVELKNYDVLVLADGRYGAFSGQIMSYVKAGGKVIALERAIRLFAQSDPDKMPSTALGKAIRNQQEEDAPDKQAPAQKAPSLRYEDRVRNEMRSQTEGSIYQVRLDDSHPLAFGQDSLLFWLKLGEDLYPRLPEGAWTVGTFVSGKPVSGFAGAAFQQKIAGTFCIATEELGAGRVIYMTDTPLFRGFWHSGLLLMANAVFFYQP